MRPAYPERNSAASYTGVYVPAECSRCGWKCYIPPKHFDGSHGHCKGCKLITEWNYWREENITNRKESVQMKLDKPCPHQKNGKCLECLKEEYIRRGDL
jgi:hypothetical protein